jgi:hypothetical protein
MEKGHKHRCKQCAKNGVFKNYTHGEGKKEGKAIPVTGREGP